MLVVDFLKIIYKVRYNKKVFSKNLMNNIMNKIYLVRFFVSIKLWKK